MAESAALVPAGLPSPRSPTLSNAEMILPDDPLRSFSPSPYIERPPSPPALLYTHSNRSAATIKIASAPQGRRGTSASPQVKSPPLSHKSSHSTIRTMGDSDEGSSSRKSSARGRDSDDALASSPTIADPQIRSHTSSVNGWNGHMQQQQRRISDTSSSVHSEDLENMNLNWLAFDGPGHFDDSGVVLEEEEEDEEKRDQFPGDANADNEADEDKWLEEQSDVGDDEYSSAALSRRAEMILANAKKRLNVMEGNLRGARQSLVVSPTFNSMKMESALSTQLSAARERDRRLYAGLGPIPPRNRQYHASPLSSNNSPGHARGMSETSVPVPFSPSYISRLPGKRASSAMGVASGPWSPEYHGQGRFPIRESRSFEVVREPKSNAWGGQDDRENSLRSYDSRGSDSPPNRLETLPEDEDGPKLHRSASTTSDLRSQMNDLKGRISSLKQRAKADHMRRRSLQSLRTPSPFTCAETWYTGTEGYKAGGSPVTADAGVGITTQSPVRKTLFEEESDNSTPKITTPIEPSHEEYHAAKQPGPPRIRDPSTSRYDALEESAVIENADDEDPEDADDNDFVSVGEEPAGESVYEDAVYEMPVAERHEDRVDAFDYEHFFLHSAMGTYSSASRRSSSSDDSVATTRPVTAIYTQDAPAPSAKRVSLHQRNPSVDSVSTVATFATAAEEQSDDDDDDDENEQMDHFSQQIITSQHPIQPRHTMQNAPMSPRSDSAINMRKANASPGQNSRGSSPGGDLTKGLQTSKIYSIMLESPSLEQPRLALNEGEKQLIYSLAASFQQVCSKLQNTYGDQYERKEWRRRLDEARRVLNGEEFEGEPF